jgi:hypothetical protein
MPKSGVILWSVLLLSGVGIPLSFACSCPEYPAFEQTARQSETVVVGRVAKVVRSVPGWRSFERGRPSPVYVDVNVERVLKGSQSLQHVRIWDRHYGSDCEGALVRFSVGFLGVFALHTVTAAEEKEIADLHGLGYIIGRLAAGEQVLPICQEAWLRLKNSREADRWSSRLRSGDRQTKQGAELPLQPKTDACRSQIPEALSQAFRRRFPERRLPSVSDSSSEDVQSDRTGGGNGCLLVQRDDFDGDGREDIAVGLAPLAGRAPVVAVALKRDRGWAISTIRAWVDDIDRLYVASAPPGIHRGTAALDTPLRPNERKSLRCDHVAVVVGATESTAITYCYARGKWLYVWVSD